MVKRVRRKVQKKKTVRRKPAVRSRKAKRKRVSKFISVKNSVVKNYKAHWDAYRQLQKKAEQAWKKLLADIKRKASLDVLLKDRNQLALLLGQCNYMTRQCTSFAAQAQKRYF